MKTLAYLFNNFNSPVVSIDEACRRKKKLASEWETRTYYDIVRLREMTATCRTGKSSSFSYLSSTNFTGHSKGSKGLTHELVKQYICKLGREWTFRIFGKEITILINSIEDEFHFKDPVTNKDYFIDCMIHLDNNCIYYDQFDGKLGIEVTDTHKTNRTKRKCFRSNNLNVLELITIPDWHIDNKNSYSKEDIIRLRGRIIGFLNKKPYLQSLNLTNKI